MSKRPAGDPNAVRVVLGPACGDARAAARRMLTRVASELYAPALRRGVPVLAHDDLGRPILVSAEGSDHVLCQVSISHRADVVAVALSPGRVGVDVEITYPWRAAALAGFWFHPAEAAWLAERPEQDRTAEFLRLWSAKEALGKALGTGLRQGGTRRRVPLGLAPGPAWTPLPGLPFALALPPCGPRLTLAVVTELPQPSLRVSGLAPTHWAACRRERGRPALS
jgi:4'-phosphopantetheinyl transferase